MYILFYNTCKYSCSFGIFRWGIAYMIGTGWLIHLFYIKQVEGFSFLHVDAVDAAVVIGYIYYILYSTVC